MANNIGAKLRELHEELLGPVPSNRSTHLVFDALRKYVERLALNDIPKKPIPGSFMEIGYNIGKLVQEKNEAYGDSFAQSCKILEVLYPDGVPVEKYRDMLGIIRVIDKLFRIATKKDALGESPWTDVTGYGILGVKNDASV